MESRLYAHMPREGSRRLRLAASLAVLAAIFAAAAKTRAQPATAALGSLNERTRVTFATRKGKVGDCVEQTVRVDLRLTTRARQGRQVLEESTTKLVRRQHRWVTATAIGPDGKTSDAAVRYVAADRALEGEPPRPDPVVGKTYHCQRTDAALDITTSEGTIPPLEEYEIVAANMETLGRENPLARFLAGRVLEVGEQVALPVETATALLGFEKQLGVVRRFDLRLVGVVTLEGRRCAEFHAEIEAQNTGAGPMRLIVGGPFYLEIASCRAVSADLSGPIGMSETRSGLGETVHLDGTGKLRVALRSRYTDSQ